MLPFIGQSFVPPSVSVQEQQMLSQLLFGLGSGSVSQAQLQLANGLGGQSYLNSLHRADYSLTKTFLEKSLASR